MARLIYWLLLLGVCATPRLVYSGDQDTVRIELERDSAGTIVRANGSPTGLIDNEATFSLKHNQVAEIRVLKCNPLLYDYVVSGVDSVQDSDYVEKVKILNSLISFLEGLLPQESGGTHVSSIQRGNIQVPPGTADIELKHSLQLDSLDCLQLMTDIKQMRNWTDSIGFSSRIDTVIARRESARTLADSASVVSRHLGQSLHYFSAINDSLLHGKGVLLSFGSFPTLSTSRENSWQRVEQAVDSLRDSELVQVLGFVKAAADSIQSLMKGDSVLQVFSKDLIHVDSIRLLKQIPYNGIYDKGLSVRFAQSRRYRPFLSKRAQAVQMAGLDSLRLIFKPHHRISLHASPAAVYSFVNEPEFTVSGTDSTNYRIIEKSSGPVKFSGLIGLDVSLTALNSSLIAPVAEIGVVTSTSHLGFLFGGGVALDGRFSACSGWILQRVNSLQNSLQVGQRVSSPDLVQTTNKFKSGVFLTLGLML